MIRRAMHIAVVGLVTPFNSVYLFHTRGPYENKTWQYCDALQFDADRCRASCYQLLLWGSNKIWNSYPFLPYNVFTADTRYLRMWRWFLTLRPWTHSIAEWCDQTLYQISAKSNNPPARYSDLNIENLEIYSSEGVNQIAPNFGRTARASSWLHPILSFGIDKLFHFEMTATERCVMSKIDAKFRTFCSDPCKNLGSWLIE